ncbi:MAG: Ppx/GppA phosphatase family protein [Mariprofundaceae bacterium]|nr:Ppx/GppA phosphatase family protein [Mariprofundaceae bacterium]
MNQPHAAIDLGSNTFRLLIARPAGSGHIPPWETMDYAHRIVRLGEGLHHSGSLAASAMQRALKALHEFTAVLKQHDISPSRTQAVATAAVREADNGRTFCDRIETETGICVRIIDGDTEAALSLQGATAVLLPKTCKNMLLFDIGGASTEFIRADNGRLMDAVSCKLGVVRLVEAFLKSDPPGAGDYQAMKQTARTHLYTLGTGWTETPLHLVGTAGTVTTLAAVDLSLFPYDADAVNNHAISRKGFYGLRDRLLGLTHAEREAMPTIEAGRADLIIAGLAIIEAMLDHWHFDRLITVDAGLLEGVWLSAMKNAD